MMNSEDQLRLSRLMQVSSSLFRDRMNSSASLLNLWLVVRCKDFDGEVLARLEPGISHRRVARSRSPYRNHIEIYCDQRALDSYKRWETIAESAGESVKYYSLSSIETGMVLMSNAARWLLACHHAIMNGLVKWRTQMLAGQSGSIFQAPPGRYFDHLDREQCSLHWYVEDVVGLSAFTSEVLARTEFPSPSQLKGIDSNTRNLAIQSEGVGLPNVATEKRKKNGVVKSNKSRAKPVPSKLKMLKALKLAAKSEKSSMTRAKQAAAENLGGSRRWLEPLMKDAEIVDSDWWPKE